MGGSLMLALGVALSPLPILAILILLGEDRRRMTATAFWLAWVGGVAGATIVSVVVVEWSDVTDSDPVWLAVTELLVGIGFVVLAGRIALSGARAVGGGPHAWIGALERSRPFQTAGLALLLSCANPKNLALILGAAVLMVDGTGQTSDLTLSAGAFVAVAAAGVSLPFAVYSLFPERLAPPLAHLRRRLVHRGRMLVVLLGFGIGAVFVTEGMRAL